jgi:glycosyltransferase involved in cell wall biosynthesis
MIRHVGVVVPAANEAFLLDRCLRALRASRSDLHRAHCYVVRTRIVLVLDSCTDASAAIAAGYPDIEVIEASVRSVGRARNAGVQHLLRSGVRASEHWLANTDADSQVPTAWLAGMVDEADRGAHLVIGTVTPDSRLPGVVDAAWHARHPQRDDHPHVHGANFGIRADAYTALGGWPLLTVGEDQTLADRARAAGHLRISRTARLPVRTSVRLEGRAPSGFSSYLRDLGQADVCPAEQNAA